MESCGTKKSNRTKQQTQMIKRPSDVLTQCYTAVPARGRSNKRGVFFSRLKSDTTRGTNVPRVSVRIFLPLHEKKKVTWFAHVELRWSPIRRLSRLRIGGCSTGVGYRRNKIPRVDQNQHLACMDMSQDNDKTFTMQGGYPSTGRCRGTADRSRPIVIRGHTAANFAGETDRSG